MNGGDFYYRTIASNTNLHSYSEKPTPRMREHVFARSATGRMNKSTSIEALGSTQAESELMDAKKTVKDLRLEIEQSNSRGKAENGYPERVKMNRKSCDDWGMSFKNYQSLEVMKELEDVKEELSRIKLDMASLLEEKRRAEKEAEASKSKAISFSSSAKRLGNEIDEINEEQVLAELARIEALKERAAIESQRKQESQKHFVEMEERRERINLMNQELDAAKVLETELAVTLADVNMLQSELNQLKEMDKINQGKEKVFKSDTPSEDEPHNPDPNSITKEIETAKNELASVTEEGFRVMASIDILRTEHRNVSEEVARVKRREEKIELAIQNLNSKLLRGRAKIEAATSAEETANSTVSNLSSTLEQYKIETEAAKKEVLLIKEENQKVNEEIDKTESEIEAAEEKLQTAIEELKSMKSSEAKALENLKALAENTMRNRASSSQHRSVITISKFEYEYLKDRAAVAEEIADKKVAAAQAWIEALKASEREILMETEKVKKETRAQMLEGKEDGYGTQISHPKKGVGESEMDIWMQNYNKNTVHEKTQHPTTMLKGSSNTSGKQTPIRRGKHRVSTSNRIPSTSRLSTSSSVSFPGRRRSKVMPNLGYLVPKLVP